MYNIIIRVCTLLIIHLENSTTLIFINLNLRDMRRKNSINRCHQYTYFNLNTKSEGKGRISGSLNCIIIMNEIFYTAMELEPSHG